jgi:hypothetical protein
LGPSPNADPRRPRRRQGRGRRHLRPVADPRRGRIRRSAAPRWRRVRGRGQVGVEGVVKVLGPAVGSARPAPGPPRPRWPGRWRSPSRHGPGPGQARQHRPACCLGEPGIGRHGQLRLLQFAKIRSGAAAPGWCAPRD